MTTIATNREAKRDFFVLETIEAGIQLKGSEVKSLRQRRATLKDSFARIHGDEIVLYNMYITPYKQAGPSAPEPKRARKLLLHKHEIKRLQGQMTQKGLALIPLRIYFTKSYAKVELALAKGKRLYDKRDAIKLREHNLEMKRALKKKGS